MPVLPFRQHSHRVELINQDALALVISQLQEEINCGGGAGAEGDYHPGCYPSLVAGSYPRDRLESHRVEGRPP